ncbi:MAG: 30S ribosomal protein S16 [Elusimicrobia bacterium]|nr:30S ribosomal protein S16 [Elusimicrobiota bacterium]
MVVKIRLKRTGRHKDPHYRVVAVDSRDKRDGKFLDNIGHYHPQDEFPNASLNMEKVEYWLGKGAQLSGTVKSLVDNLKNPAKRDSRVKKLARLSAKAEEKKSEKEDNAAEPDKGSAETQQIKENAEKPQSEGKPENNTQENPDNDGNGLGKDKGSEPDNMLDKEE